MHEQREPRRNKKYATEEERQAAKRASHLKYREANREKVRAASRAYIAADPRRKMAKHLQSTYGITVEDFEEMLSSQGGRCKICECAILHHLADAAVRDKACVDHCHTTGRVRGLLCHYCNRSLAFVESHGEAAMNYLKE